MFVVDLPRALTERFPKIHRYADPGESVAGYSTHAGQCAAALLFCFLHFRHHRCAAVGGASEEPLLPQGELYPVSKKLTLLSPICHSTRFFFFSIWAISYNCNSCFSHIASRPPVSSSVHIYDPTLQDQLLRLSA